MSDADIHTEHCCKEHGCKYEDHDCTVTSGLKPQSFPCETCQFIEEGKLNWTLEEGTDWVEVNLPWRHFNKEENEQHGNMTRQYVDWIAAERMRMFSPSPSLDEYKTFNVWLKEQPETKEWERLEAEYKANTDGNQFASHPANKAGVLIEIRDRHGDTLKLLIGDILTDGGDSGEWGLLPDDIVLRYRDLSEIIGRLT